MIIVERLRAAYANFGRMSHSARGSMLYALMSRQRRWIRFYVAWTAVASLFTFQVSLALVDMVDRGIVDQSIPLESVRNRIIVIGVLGGVMMLLSRLIGERVVYHIEFEARVWVYTRLQAARLERLDAFGTGQVVTRAMTDLRLIEQVVRLIPTLIAIVPVLVVLPLVLTILNPLMGFIAVMALPVNLLLLLRLGPKLRALSWTELNQRGRITTAMDEPVRGIRVVKAFGREDHERARVESAARHAYRVALSRVRLLARYDLLLKFFPIAVQSLILLIGARLVASDRLTLGTFLLAVQVGLAVVQISLALDEIAGLWQFMRGAQDRLAEVLALGRRSTASGGDLPPPANGLVVESVAVDVGGVRVLDGIDLSCRPGELVVVHGAPRSGKSTLAAAIAGLMELTDGQVLLDGAPLTDLNQRDLRRAIRVVSEEPFLFAESVRENLAMAAPADVEGEALRAALHAAGADDVIEQLSNGIDTELGDRGLTLSGGQRQRIGLARSLVSPPRVLVLDDALSAVNPSLEREILLRIRAHAPATAVVLISRRRGALEIADAVVTLPDAIEHHDVMVADTPSAIHDGAPFDPELASLVNTMQVGRDRPHASDEEIARDAPPRASNVTRPVMGVFAVAVVMLFLQNAAEISPQVAFADIANVVEDSKVGSADLLALSLIGIGIVGAAAAYAFKIHAQQFGQSILFLLRMRVFRRLSQLGVDYYDRELPGRVAARVVNDIDTVETFVAQRIFLFLSSIAKLVISFAAIYILSSNMATTVAVLIAVAAVGTAIHLPVAMRSLNRARDELGLVVTRFEEDFLARQEIRAFGAEDRRRREFTEAAWELRRARRWSSAVRIFYQSFLETFGYVASAVVLFRGGVLVLEGALAVGTALALQLLVRQATQPLPLLADSYTALLDLRVSWRRLQEPFDEAILPIESADARPCPPLAGEVRFDAVDFAYPHTGSVVLRDVSFDIPAGTVCALVGYTGAGKSSIAKLLSRTYDPDRGAVRVDGQDLRTLHLRDYRSRLGIVPQDAFVFRGTIADNIRYGRPDATREEVQAAATAVGAHELLSIFDDGYDHAVEEEGRNLTAAQRQLMALARAWITRPDVLVLDEATASLDLDLENRVLEAVMDLGITTLMISHRENVVSRCPWVVVLEAGRIVEVGPPHELARSGQAFRRLWATDAEVEATTRTTAPEVESLVDEVFTQIRRKRAGTYRTAVDLMTSIRRLTDEAGEPERFEALVDQIRTEHSSKRSLTAMLDNAGW